MMEAENKVIGEVKTGNIVVSILELGNGKYVDIRKYFMDDDGEMKPTKKGIALSKDQFNAVLALLNEKKDEIAAAI